MPWTPVSNLSNSINDPLDAGTLPLRSGFVFARQGDRALNETFYTEILEYLPLDRPGEDGNPIGDAPIPRPFVGIDFSTNNPSVEVSVIVIQPEEMVRRYNTADGVHGVQFGVTYKESLASIAVATATVVSVFYADVNFDRANRERFRIILG